MARHTRRRRPESATDAGKNQFQCLLALLVILVVCVLIEIVVVDTVLVAPSVNFNSIQLSSQDFFISDSGALPQAVYLHDSSRVISNDVANDQYGRGATIVGLDTCRHYRTLLDEGDLASIAIQGIFLNHVSLFSQLMRRNCEIAEGGKSAILMHHSDVEGHFPLLKLPSSVLPVVIVEDPLPWMANICRNRPKGLHLDAVHCPAMESTVQIRVSVSASRNSTSHRSLAHLWNEWYEPWLSHHSSPRLIIRSEDVLLFPQELVTSVCECLGGRTLRSFHARAPWHVDALPNRFDMYDRDTLKYAKDNLDATLLDVLGYSLHSD